MFETKLKLGRNPKEKAGIFSRLTFFYLDELFASGFASERGKEQLLHRKTLTEE